MSISGVLQLFGLVLGLAIITEAAAVGRLWRRRQTFAQYWLRRRENAGRLVYVALGDSAAQGLGASSPEKGYVGVVATRLEQRLGQTVRVVNLSVSGARVADVIAKQLPQLGQYRPNWVTLDVGSNDLRQFDLATWAAQVETLCAGLPRNTVIANLPPFAGQRAAAAKKANVVLEAAARKYGLRLADIHAAITHHHSWRNYAADWFHPNNRGYGVWTEAVWQVIESINLPSNSKLVDEAM